MSDNYFSMLLVCRCLRPKAQCTCAPEDAGEYDHRDVAPPKEPEWCLRTDGASAPLPCSYSKGHTGPCYFRW